MSDKAAFVAWCIPGFLFFCFALMMAGEFRDCYGVAVEEKAIFRLRRDRICYDKEEVAQLDLVADCQKYRRKAEESATFNAFVEMAARYSLCGKEGCKEVLGDMTSWFYKMCLLGVLLLYMYVWTIQKSYRSMVAEPPSPLYHTKVQ